MDEEYTEDAEEAPETFSGWLTGMGFPHGTLTDQQLDSMLVMFLDRQAGFTEPAELVADDLDPDSEID